MAKFVNFFKLIVPAIGASCMPVFAQDIIASSAQDYDSALEQDAQSYASAYGIGVIEAKRRLMIMTQSADEIEALETELGDSLSGAYFDNGADFKLVLRTTASPKTSKSLKLGGRGKGNGSNTPDLELPVVYVAGGVSRKAAKLLVKDGKNSLGSTFPNLQSTSYDERSGELVFLIRGNDDETAALKANEASLSKKYKMPVRIDVAPVIVKTMAVRGGQSMYLSDGTTPWCTTAFVAKNAAGNTGVLTAGHCTTSSQSWVEGTTKTPLTSTTQFTANKDYAFLQGAVSMVGEFYANKGEVARKLTGRRTKAATTVKTTTVAGSYVCMYGRNSGPVYGQACGEVVSTSYAPAYAAPGCNNGPGYVACNSNFVQIKPKGAEIMYTRGGDSGAPVFAITVAFGIFSGSSNYTTGNTDRAYDMIYTSIDEIYNDGYSLVFAP
jgi:hypothetical protein